jgi:hypothetical protein
MHLSTNSKAIKDLRFWTLYKSSCAGGFKDASIKKDIEVILNILKHIKLQKTRSIKKVVTKFTSTAI